MRADALLAQESGTGTHTHTGFWALSLFKTTIKGPYGKLTT